jgi:hypothetical protein
VSTGDNVWGHRPESGHTAGASLAGYKVDATDGHIGKVDKHNDPRRSRRPYVTGVGERRIPAVAVWEGSGL